MDDIFSDNKEDAEKETDSNIEWKKSGIDKHERLTLKINVKEANLYNASKSNNLKARDKVKNPLEVPKGFKKVSKKIRDAYDDEEDEDDYIIVPVFENMEETSLMQALTEEEKNFLKQNEHINNIKMQDNAGKEAALEYAEKVIMQAGLGKIDKKLANRERNKNNVPSAEDIIADVLKQKTEKLPQEEKPKAKDFRQESKIKTTVKEFKKTKQENKQEAVAAQKPQKTANGEPVRLKETKRQETEVASIKAEEKAAVERSEKEISSGKEEKAPNTADKQNKVEDKVNKDEINKTEPAKENKEEIRPDTDNKHDQPQKAETERQLQQIDRDDKIIEAKAKEIVRVERQVSDENKTDAKKPDKEEKQSSKEVKELIKEKSGRPHSEAEKLKQEQNKTSLSDKEYQKALEAKVKMYQDRER